jgi:nitrogen fixation protein FixH
MMSRRNAYRWIPWTFVGGLAVVVAVNGVLAYFAIVSSTGLVTEQPFERGNDYNRVLDAAAAQDALGWRGAVHFAPSGDSGGALAAELTDRSGRPLSGLSVTARLVRPVEPLPDLVVPLAEIGGGRYAAVTAVSRPGQWDVQVVARQGAALFAFAQRIVVK